MVADARPAASGRVDPLLELAGLGLGVSQDRRPATWAVCDARPWAAALGPLARVEHARGVLPPLAMYAAAALTPRLAVRRLGPSADPLLGVADDAEFARLDVAVAHADVVERPQVVCTIAVGHRECS